MGFKLKAALATVGMISLLSGNALAAPTISSYDVTNAQLSGFGGWGHTYNGTISGNSYSGGGGTLNDGVFGTSEGNTQLFQLSDRSTITLHLGSSSTIGEISLYSFSQAYNAIPGSIIGLNITINSITQVFLTTGFGPANPGGGGRDHSNELIDLTGSSLDGLMTDTITLSGFTTSGSFADYYAISEITLGEGSGGQVPEPGALALFGISIAALGIARRRKSPAAH